MALVKRPFGDTFTFARPVAASYRDSNGVLASAASNVPRFDHGEDGSPRGLLIELGGDMGQHDALATVEGWDAGVTKAMVLHEYEIDGEIRRTAFYTATPKAVVDGCLAIAAWHRELIVLDGWKRNRGGYVRFDRRNWSLGDAIAVDPGMRLNAVLAVEPGKPLIEG